MLQHKAFRFRVYPRASQERRIREWDNALRWLWNIAHEQRLMGLARTDKRYPKVFDQINELTLLRRELPWLADVPRNVCAQVLVRLDAAWQRYLKRIGGMPHWKRKGVGFTGLTEPHPKTWRLRGNMVRFPKLGDMPIVAHRQLEGKPKTCTLRREGDQWFVSILCEIEANPVPRLGPVVALDRGITNLLASSDGALTPNPRFLQKSLARIAHAQRVVSRREKGSRRQEKARVRVMRLHRKVRRQRDHALHVESARLANSHGVIVIEKLNVRGMLRGNMSRSISDAGWTKFAQMLRYKLAWSGGALFEVPAAYSSQTCSACGAVDAASRCGQRYHCTSCGYLDHADLNAARVLKQRYEAPGNPWCLPVEGSLLEGTHRSGKLKVSLRVPRRPISEKPRPSGRG